MPIVFHEGRNRAFAELDAPINGSDVNIVLATGQGARLSNVTTASGRKVRANIYHRDSVTGAITKIETVEITNNVSDVLTVSRGAESTRADDSNTYAATPQSFEAGDIIEEVITSEVITELQDEINNIYDVELPLKADQADVDALSNVYAAASGGTDNYAFTIPGFTSYAANVGKHFTFLSDVANNGASGVNISGLGNIPMYKNHDQNTETGDVEASQLVEIVIGVGGTYVEMVSQVAKIVDLSTYDTKGTTITAGENLFAGDVLYPSANDTMDRVRPIDFASNTATFTEATGGEPEKIMKIDATRQLHMAGGYMGTALGFSAKIGTINAGETDCTYGSAYTAGAVNIQTFDICQFDTTKFLVFYLQNPSAGYKAVVLDVGSSGSTITNGPIQTIETTGNGAQIACCALDSSRVALLYTRDSDTKLYIQIISISGTTITTNTAVVFDNTNTTGGTGRRCVMEKIDTNKLLVVYAAQSYDPLVAKTIDVSGTVPTVNGSNTLVATSDQYKLAKLAVLSATKVALVYGDHTIGNNDTYACILSISGSTVTKGSNLTLSTTGTAIANAYGNVIALSPSVLLTCTKESATSVKAHLLYVDGTTITSTATVSINTATLTYEGGWVCKLKPFKYLVCSGEQYCFVTLSDNVAKRVGIAQADIVDAATGSMYYRFKVSSIFSGLTAGSSYYIDDSGRATTESSSLSTRLGNAINATNILIE